MHFCTFPGGLSLLGFAKLVALLQWLSVWIMISREVQLKTPVGEQVSVTESVLGNPRTESKVQDAVADGPEQKEYAESKDQLLLRIV